MTHHDTACSTSGSTRHYLRGELSGFFVAAGKTRTVSRSRRCPAHGQAEATQGLARAIETFDGADRGDCIPQSLRVLELLARADRRPDPTLELLRYERPVSFTHHHAGCHPKRTPPGVAPTHHRQRFVRCRRQRNKGAVRLGHVSALPRDVNASDRAPAGVLRKAHAGFRIGDV